MTRNSYISMVFTNIIDKDPTIHPEVVFNRAVAAADFLESKGVAPWKEPARFTIPAQEMQAMQAKAAAAREAADQAREAANDIAPGTVLPMTTEGSGTTPNP